MKAPGEVEDPEYEALLAKLEYYVCLPALFAQRREMSEQTPALFHLSQRNLSPEASLSAIRDHVGHISEVRDDDLSTVNKRFLLWRGWTDGEINHFLGEPDLKVNKPRLTRKDRPERVYRMERVLAAEASKEFKQHRVDKESRASARQQSAEQKTRKRALSTLAAQELKRTGSDLADRDKRILSILLIEHKGQRAAAKAVEVSQQTVSLVYDRFMGVVLEAARLRLAELKAVRESMPDDDDEEPHDW